MGSLWEELSDIFESRRADDEIGGRPRNAARPSWRTVLRFSTKSKMWKIMARSLLEYAPLR
jgi:hypothetical protein